MPQYEYICEKDGEVLTLLRPMRDADAPVADPKALGRVFIRKHSVFGVAGSSSGGGHVHSGPSCPCGKPQSSCGSRN
ncbi:MAG: hypothetical protein EXS00_04420 [Phycisphaerales bacterium]|nr:hypothetical protein [Phycisphaerales bacterium]